MWGTAISGIKTITELLIKLFESRTVNRRDFFESQIEPIFQYLLKIHEDYIGAVAEVIGFLNEFTYSSESIRESLIDRKRKLEHIRSLVRNLADSIHSTSSEKLGYNFAWSVVYYFSFSIGTHNEMGKTWLKGLIGITEQLMDGELTREEYQSEIAEIEERLNDNWHNVTKEYAELKVKCLNGT